MALTIEQEQYYDQMDEMFATRGWEQLCDELRTHLEVLKNAALDSPENAPTLSGEAKMLVYLLRLENTLETQKRLYEEDDHASV